MCSLSQGVLRSSPLTLGNGPGKSSSCSCNHINTSVSMCCLALQHTASTPLPPVCRAMHKENVVGHSVESLSLRGVLEGYLDNKAQGCEHGDTAVGDLGLPPPPQLPAQGHVTIVENV